MQTAPPRNQAVAPANPPAGLPSCPPTQGQATWNATSSAYPRQRRGGGPARGSTPRKTVPGNLSRPVSGGSPLCEPPLGPTRPSPPRSHAIPPGLGPRSRRPPPPPQPSGQGHAAGPLCAAPRCPVRATEVSPGHRPATPLTASGGHPQRAERPGFHVAMRSTTSPSYGRGGRVGLSLQPSGLLWMPFSRGLERRRLVAVGCLRSRGRAVPAPGPSRSDAGLDDTANNVGKPPHGGLSVLRTFASGESLLPVPTCRSQQVGNLRYAPGRRCPGKPNGFVALSPTLACQQAYVGSPAPPASTTLKRLWLDSIT